MRKSNKKGFTMVELVIVIAVVAILAAVLIPTFLNLTKKANTSVDAQLVRNLNAALQIDKVENGNHETMHDAIHALMESGFDITKIKTSDEANRIVWDSKNDVFCLYDGRKIQYIPEDGKVKTELSDADYFAIYTEIPAEQKFSIYWNGEENVPEDTELTVGFDAGHSQSDVTYNGEGTVIVRMFGGSLTVEKGNVTVYGFVGDAYFEGTVTAAAGTRFHGSEDEVCELTTDNGAEFGCHLFGEDGNATRCLVKDCKEANPNHTCTVGEIKARKDENANKWYADVYCSICNNVMYSVEIGEIEDESGNPVTPTPNPTPNPECDHTYGKQKVTAATCEKEGVTIEVCTRCGYIHTVSTTPALGHNYVDGHDETNHWSKCTKCQKEINKGEHNYSVRTYTCEGDKYYNTCSTCGYKAEQYNISTAIKCAMELNEKLAGTAKHNTMHDVLTELAKSYSSITAVAQKIDAAEGALSHRVVWDQVIDRFVVVTTATSSTGNSGFKVVYTPATSNEYWAFYSWGSYSEDNFLNSGDAYPLWDIVGTQDELLKYGGVGSAGKQSFSIYYSGTALKNYNDSDINPSFGSLTFSAGFDLGEATVDTQGDTPLTISISVSVNSQVFASCDVDYIVRTNSNGNGVSLQTKGQDKNPHGVRHYGDLNKFCLSQYMNYYEYGTVKEVAVNEIDGSKISKNTTIIYAMSGSKFAQSKTVIEALGCKVESKGGLFEQALN